MHNWFFLTAMFLTVGCEQTQTIGSCGGDATDGGAKLQLAPGDGGQGGGDGAGGMGGQGGAPLIGPGGPCNTNDECADGACLASKNDFSFGYCYAPFMTGCIVITDPAPQKANCAGSTKRLYVCGDAEDLTQWGQNCVAMDVGSFGETYHCCDKP